jgi:ribosome biogenesis GTPase
MVDAQLTDLYGTVVAVQANFYQVRLDSAVMGESSLYPSRSLAKNWSIGDGW